MSSQWVDRRVRCGNDCRQDGCPRHDLRLKYHHTSDTVGVEMDGRSYVVFDSDIWRALVNMDAQIRDRDRADAHAAKQLDEWAAQFNRTICEQEGYDPVSVEWIREELEAAYRLGKGNT